MAPRYNVQRNARGWTVYDTTTGHPAELGGAVLLGLSAEDADDLVDLLNRLENNLLPHRTDQSSDCHPNCPKPPTTPTAYP